MTVLANRHPKPVTDLACLTIDHELKIQHYFAFKNVDPMIVRPVMNTPDDPEDAPFTVIPESTICILAGEEDKNHAPE